ncbi:MAG: leucine-rich repeat domain-containing protein [Alphaproteobacteria bacterium]|nr:leucine-rich repeat domain-containing protein [Alphaproteobacteria bacterium]
MKKFFKISVLVLGSLLIAGVSAAEEGCCNDSCTCQWTLAVDGTMTISGTNRMKNYNQDNLPWKNQLQSIKSVVIEPGGVYSISSVAFYGATNLTSVSIPNTVTNIGQHAFRDTSLTSLTIPSSVTNIDKYAFRDITTLQSLTFEPGSQLTSIGMSAFRGTSALTSVVLPSSITTIEQCAFCHDTGLTSVTIPNSVTSIGYEAFYGTSNLTSITIPDSVTTIEGKAFYGNTSLETINFGENSKLTSIGELAFYNDSTLKSITVPDTVTTIGKSAFYGNTALENVNFGENSKLTSIGELAFFNNDSLTSITIPDTVKTIGERAFYLADNLTKIIIGDGVTSIGENAFKGLPSNAKIYCQNTSQNRCSSLIGENNDSALSKVVLFEKDETGVYKIGEGDNAVYYASAADLTSQPPVACTDLRSCQIQALKNKGTACDTEKECAALIDQANTGQFLKNGKFYASLKDFLSGNYERKRIYTIKEANQVAGNKNSVMIRYK